MKNKKKIILTIFCIVILIALIYEIVHIWALFQSDVTGQTTFAEAKWNVEVNGTNVTQKEVVKFKISDLNTETSTHVKEGNFAPGLSTLFKVKIDPKDTQVSIRYDINVDDASIKNTNISVTEIKEKNGRSLVETSKGVFTGIIPLTDITNGTVDELNITLKWEDVDETTSNTTTNENADNSEETESTENSEESEGTDTSDSIEGSETNQTNTSNFISDENLASDYDAKVNLPVYIVLSQYQGETIKAYNAN